MDLKQFFESQDQTLEKHLGSSKLFRKAFEMISAACSLITSSIPALQFQTEKKQVLGILAVEILTGVGVATRLSLSGNTPEGLSILRFGIERTAQLVFIVEGQKYKTALYEFENGFNQVSYETVFRSSGAFGKRLEVLHGQISGVASHASAARINWYSIERDGKVLFGPLYDLEDQRVAITLEWSLDAVFLVLNVLDLAYEQDSLAFNRKDEYSVLLGSYYELKHEFDLRLGRQSQTPVPTT